jgi:hypothetical protein
MTVSPDEVAADHAALLFMAAWPVLSRDKYRRAVNWRQNVKNVARFLRGFMCPYILSFPRSQAASQCRTSRVRL